MKKILTLIIIASAYAFFEGQHLFTDSPTVPSQNNQPAADYEDQLQVAFNNKQSDIQVMGKGIVIKTLADDLNGSRHQKFLLKLNSGQTLLVAHNIDLAPKIIHLKKGDSIEFYGEYEWNKKGGVIHWTHHDPAKRHIGGWLKHQNKLYQ